MPQTSTTEIHELLQPDTVRVGLPGANKEEVIDNLLDLLAGHPVIEDMEQVRQAVWEREDVMSTGVGKGLGLPHAKTTGVTATAAAFAITAEPVDFGSIDDEPVRLLFLLVGTEAAKSQHIKILSRVSRLMNRDNLRSKLLKAQSSEEVLEIFAAGEEHIAQQ